MAPKKRRGKMSRSPSPGNRNLEGAQQASTAGPSSSGGGESSSAANAPSSEQQQPVPPPANPQTTTNEQRTVQPTTSVIVTSQIARPSSRPNSREGERTSPLDRPAGSRIPIHSAAVAPEPTTASGRESPSSTSTRGSIQAGNARNARAGAIVVRGSAAGRGSGRGRGDPAQRSSRPSSPAGQSDVSQPSSGRSSAAGRGIPRGGDRPPSAAGSQPSSRPSSRPTSRVGRGNPLDIGNHPYTSNVLPAGLPGRGRGGIPGFMSATASSSHRTAQTSSRGLQERGGRGLSINAAAAQNSRGRGQGTGSSSASRFPLPEGGGTVPSSRTGTPRSNRFQPTLPPTRPSNDQTPSTNEPPRQESPGASTQSDTAQTVGADNDGTPEGPIRIVTDVASPRAEEPATTSPVAKGYLQPPEEDSDNSPYTSPTSSIAVGDDVPLPETRAGDQPTAQAPGHATSVPSGESRGLGLTGMSINRMLDAITGHSNQTRDFESAPFTTSPEDLDIDSESPIVSGLTEAGVSPEDMANFQSALQRARNGGPPVEDNTPSYQFPPNRAPGEPWTGSWQDNPDFHYYPETIPPQQPQILDVTQPAEVGPTTPDSEAERRYLESIGMTREEALARGQTVEDEAPSLSDIAWKGSWQDNPNFHHFPAAVPRQEPQILDVTNPLDIEPATPDSERERRYLESIGMTREQALAASWIVEDETAVPGWTSRWEENPGFHHFPLTIPAQEGVQILDVTSSSQVTPSTPDSRRERRYLGSIGMTRQQAIATGQIVVDETPAPPAWTGPWKENPDFYSFPVTIPPSERRRGMGTAGYGTRQRQSQRPVGQLPAPPIEPAGPSAPPPFETNPPTAGDDGSTSSESLTSPTPMERIRSMQALQQQSAIYNPFFQPPSASTGLGSDGRMPRNIAEAAVMGPGRQPPMPETAATREAREARETQEMDAEAITAGVDIEEFRRQFDMPRRGVLGNESLVGLPARLMPEAVQEFKTWARGDDKKDKDCVQRALAALEALEDGQVNMVAKLLTLEHANDSLLKAVAKSNAALNSLHGRPDDEKEREIRRLNRELRGTRARNEELENENQNLEDRVIQLDQQNNALESERRLFREQGAIITRLNDLIAAQQRELDEMRSNRPAADQLPTNVNELRMDVLVQRREAERAKHELQKANQTISSIKEGRDKYFISVTECDKRGQALYKELQNNLARTQKELGRANSTIADEMVGSSEVPSDLSEREEESVHDTRAGENCDRYKAVIITLRIQALEAQEREKTLEDGIEEKAVEILQLHEEIATLESLTHDQDKEIEELNHALGNAKKNERDLKACQGEGERLRENISDLYQALLVTRNQYNSRMQRCPIKSGEGTWEQLQELVEKLNRDIAMAGAPGGAATDIEVATRAHLQAIDDSDEKLREEREKLDKCLKEKEVLEIDHAEALDMIERYEKEAKRHKKKITGLKEKVSNNKKYWEDEKKQLRKTINRLLQEVNKGNSELKKSKRETRVAEGTLAEVVAEPPRMASNETTWSSQSTRYAQDVAAYSVDFAILRTEIAMREMVYERSLFGMQDGDTDAAIDIGLEALERAQETGSEPLVARSHFWLALAYFYTGRFDEGSEHINRGHALVDWDTHQEEFEAFLQWREIGDRFRPSQRRSDYRGPEYPQGTAASAQTSPKAKKSSAKAKSKKKRKNSSKSGKSAPRRGQSSDAARTTPKTIRMLREEFGGLTRGGHF